MSVIVCGCFQWEFVCVCVFIHLFLLFSWDVVFLQAQQCIFNKYVLSESIPHNILPATERLEYAFWKRCSGISRLTLLLKLSYLCTYTRGRFPNQFINLPDQKILVHFGSHLLSLLKWFIFKNTSLSSGQVCTNIFIKSVHIIGR